MPHVHVYVSQLQLKKTRDNTHDKFENLTLIDYESHCGE